MKRITLALLCVGLVLPAYAGATGLTVSQPQTDGNGVIWYDATSSYNGPGSTILRVLPPTNPAPGISHRFIYVLPVFPDVDLQDEFGDGLEELLALNVHNDYNTHIIAPSFKAEPWYADHESNPERRYESFMVRDLVPWVQANLSVTGQEEHWLIGFSKSGFGAVTLQLRNPTVFDATAAWDFPADQSDAYIYGMLDNYGTDANFQNNYRLTSDWIAARKEPFQTAPRLWLSKDYVTYYGIPTFRDEVLAFAGRLSANDVQFMLAGGATRTHSWTSGWLPQAVAGLQDRLNPGQPPPPPNPSSARDDFNRADGGLGPDWVMDPAWGSGISISGNRVVSTLSNGGAYFWDANGFGADQYSQIKITGAIGDWTGVSVRGAVVPAQGYWVAIKSDGAHLYSFLNNAFHELLHDTTPWSTGDVLRLEVETVAANTARLTVYRNGSPLVIYDDADHFIASGQPGLGLYATAAMSLDDWEGGTLDPGHPPPPPPPNPSSARDDFNRADGGLGPDWVMDPAWGSGISISGNRVVSTLSNGGAYFWDANGFGADQYSQIKITGAIGDWTGVSVRGAVVPAQGYWVAIKSDGAHLYSFLNNTFHELLHDTTPWSTGDVLRLEVQTVAANTARLTVYRNGSVLVIYDDADHFIASGQPGLGLYATAAMSLDDWEGGTLDPGQ